MRSAAAPLACLALWGCNAQPTEIIAWPGMEATEFNRLNEKTGAKLQTDETDWIGINSPAILLFKYRGKEVGFSGWRRGGGIMIGSFPRYGTDGAVTVLPKVDSINFNIGGGMENVADFLPMLAGYCSDLAKLAGEPQPTVPSASAISDGFDLNDQAATDIEICSGGGDEFDYAITATHYTDDWEHGGDPAYALLNGSLHSPMRPD